MQRRTRGDPPSNFRPRLQTLVQQLGCPHAPEARPTAATNPFLAYADLSEPLVLDRLMADLELFQQHHLPRPHQKGQKRNAWDQLVRRFHWSDGKVRLHQVMGEAMPLFWSELQPRLGMRKTMLLREAHEGRSLDEHTLRSLTLEAVSDAYDAFLQEAPQGLMKEYQASVRASEVPQTRDQWFPRARGHLHFGAVVAVTGNFDFIRQCPGLLLEHALSLDPADREALIQEGEDPFRQPFVDQGLLFQQYLATCHLAVMMPVSRRFRTDASRPTQLTLVKTPGGLSLAVQTPAARRLHNMAQRVETETSLANPTPRLRCPALDVRMGDTLSVNAVRVLREYTREIVDAHLFPEITRKIARRVREGTAWRSWELDQFASGRISRFDRT